MVVVSMTARETGSCPAVRSSLRSLESFDRLPIATAARGYTPESNLFMDRNGLPAAALPYWSMPMPRFYFHIQTTNGLNEEDEVGAVFRSETDAIREAGALADEMMLDAVKSHHNVRHVIEVMDADRKVLARLDCTAATDAKTVKTPRL
jgi:hypothetical protein